MHEAYRGGVMNPPPYAVAAWERDKAIKRLAAEAIRRERETAWLASLTPQVRDLYQTERGR